MIETILAIIAWIAFTISGVFQILRMKKTQSSRDISILFIVLLFIGVLATTGLAWLAGSLPFIIERTVNSFFSLAILIMVIYYRWKKRK